MNQAETKSVLGTMAAGLVDGEEEGAAGLAVFDEAVADEVIGDGIGRVGDFVESSGSGNCGEEGGWWGRSGGERDG